MLQICCACSACVFVCKQLSGAVITSPIKHSENSLWSSLDSSAQEENRSSEKGNVDFVFWPFGYEGTIFCFYSIFLVFFLSYFSYCRAGTSSGIVSSSPRMVWHSFTCLFIIKTTQTHCSNQLTIVSSFMNISIQVKFYGLDCPLKYCNLLGIFESLALNPNLAGGLFAPKF